MKELTRKQLEGRRGLRGPAPHNAYDYFNHPCLKNRPGTDLSGNLREISSALPGPRPAATERTIRRGGKRAGA